MILPVVNGNPNNTNLGVMSFFTVLIAYISSLFALSRMVLPTLFVGWHKIFLGRLMLGVSGSLEVSLFLVIFLVLPL